MPYDLAPRLFPDDLPPPCSKDVEVVLESDRLFWLDPKNKARIQFERALVPGEELPYKLSAEKDKQGVAHVRVVVREWGRTFLFHGKPVLIIVDKPEPKDKKIDKAKKKDRDHGIKNTMAEFRRFMGEYAKQVRGVRESSVARKPDADTRKAQGERDKLRAQERRESKRAERSTLTESKRARGKKALRAADASAETR